MKLKFLIAEEFRPEANNKISALGVFAGDVIILLKKPDQPATEKALMGLERLAFLVTVSELDGTHNFKGAILDPNRNQMELGIKSLGDGVVIQPGLAHTVVVEAKPFVIKIPGIYTFVFYIDDDPYEFPFEIRTSS